VAADDFSCARIVATEGKASDTLMSSLAPFTGAESTDDAGVEANDNTDEEDEDKDAG
jgi:hypothetical protein